MGRELLDQANPTVLKKRKPRADAIRNRERVLQAAKAVFSQGDPEASLEAVGSRGISVTCAAFRDAGTII